MKGRNADIVQMRHRSGRSVRNALIRQLDIPIILEALHRVGTASWHSHFWLCAASEIQRYPLRFSDSVPSGPSVVKSSFWPQPDDTFNIH